ncbi:uncharacterized protein LOC141501205 [Macrotis lagotis]|uniref:uncharacterized protein LOC141501205 n=1 Tax=Macrotis lagotis TaxID=92651 RepID=UPI003D69E294
MIKTLSPIERGLRTVVPSMRGSTGISILPSSISEPTELTQITPGEPTSNKGTLKTPWTERMTLCSTTFLVPSASLGTITPASFTMEPRIDAPSPSTASEEILYPENGVDHLASTAGSLPITSTKSSPVMTSTSVLQTESNSVGSPQVSETSKASYGSLISAETPVDQVKGTSMVFHTGSPLATTLGPISGILGTSLTAETSSHPESTIIAETSSGRVSVTGMDEASTVPWLLSPSETSVGLLSTTFNWLWTPTLATPEISSRRSPMADGMTSAIPGAERPNLTPSSKLRNLFLTSPTSFPHTESPTSGRGPSLVSSMTTSLSVGSTSSTTSSGAPVSSFLIVSSPWEGSRAYEVLPTGSEINPLQSFTTPIIEGSTGDVLAIVTGVGNEGRLSRV